jgi:hypothetical protein
MDELYLAWPPMNGQGDSILFYELLNSKPNDVSRAGGAGDRDQAGGQAGAMMPPGA